MKLLQLFLKKKTKQKKNSSAEVVGYECTRLSKMPHNILLFLAYLNFELTSLKGLWAKVAATSRKGVVFS